MAETQTTQKDTEAEKPHIIEVTYQGGFEGGPTKKWSMIDEIDHFINSNAFTPDLQNAFKTISKTILDIPENPFSKTQSLRQLLECKESLERALEMVWLRTGTWTWVAPKEPLETNDFAVAK